MLEYKPVKCSHCGDDLDELFNPRFEKRQVYDIVIRQEIAEHRCISGQCPRCDESVSGKFPEGVNAPVQYGNGVSSLAVYMNVHQFIPAERNSEFIRMLLGGTGPSASTFMSMLNRAGEKLLLTYSKSAKESYKRRFCM